MLVFFSLTPYWCSFHQHVLGLQSYSTPCWCAFHLLHVGVLFNTPYSMLVFFTNMFKVSNHTLLHVGVLFTYSMLVFFSPTCFRTQSYSTPCWCSFHLLHVGVPFNTPYSMLVFFTNMFKVSNLTPCWCSFHQHVLGLQSYPMLLFFSARKAAIGTEAKLPCSSGWPGPALPKQSVALALPKQLNVILPF
jgi:hypothetical protein